MSQETSPSQRELEELRSRLAEVERRLAGIDRRLGIARSETPTGEVREPTAERPEVREPTAERPEAAFALTDVLPLIGRTFVVLGGAFVLRAVTESGLLQASVGAALGLVYAVVWFAMADRAAGRGARRSALWHGVAAVVIAYPLLWETTAGFAFLGPTEATGALTAITVAGLIVAWRRDLRGLGWIVTLSAVGIALALAVAVKLVVPMAAFLLLLGVATLALGYSRGWQGPGWLVAGSVNFMIGLVTLIALRVDAERTGELFHDSQVMGLQLALVLLYVGCLFARTWIADTDLSPPEIVVGIAAFAIGLGGAIALVAKTGSGGAALGVVALALGAAGYVVAFRLVDRRSGRINFIFFSSLALVSSLVGAGELMPPTVFTLAMVVGGLAMAWAGAWRDRATLNVHGAVYALAATVASGLFAGAVASLATPGKVDSDWVSGLSWASMIGALGYCAFPVASHGRTWGRVSTLPRLVVLAMALVGAGGTVVAGVATWLPRGESGEVSPQALAILRTAVLAVSSVTLAALGRFTRLEQARWLVYPVLVAGGLKLLVEDLRVESPAGLVASFALYGSALIVAPGLAHRSKVKDRDV